MFDPVGLALTKALNACLGILGGLFSGRVAKRRRARRSRDGEDFFAMHSLEQTLRKQLQRLAATPSAFPEALRGETFRNWLLDAAFLEQFVALFTAFGGDDRIAARGALDALAEQYARVTGETRQRAEGPVRFVVSHVAGQLHASTADSAALNAILIRKLVAGMGQLLRSVPEAATEADDLRDVASLSSILLEAGRQAWKFPRFIAPLALAAYEPGSAPATRRLHAADLMADLAAGGRFVLFGEGGTGKTTFMLELAALCSATRDGPLPLYVDAATWAQADSEILDYIAATAPARALALTAGKLARLAGSGRLLLLINGWNEIPATKKLQCHASLNLLLATSGKLGIAITTRTQQDLPHLDPARHVEVLGLEPKGVRAIIEAELGPDAAIALRRRLAADWKLAEAARSPLILRGLVSNAASGMQQPMTPYHLLGAVVTALERDYNRGLVLDGDPVFGLQSAYLEALAWQMTVGRTTTLPVDDALSSIGAVVRRSEQAGMLHHGPASRPILTMLSNHHVLHTQDKLVRFAHQRFQEYFAATRLLRRCISGDESELLEEIWQAPKYWIDEILLVCGVLKGAGEYRLARAVLTCASAQAGLLYASAIAGLCGFREDDDSELYQWLLSGIDKYLASDAAVERAMARQCAVFTRFPAFTEAIWRWLEDEDEIFPCFDYPVTLLRVDGILISQLGPAATERLRGCPAALRKKIVLDLARYPENVEAMLKFVVTDPDAAVRSTWRWIYREYRWQMRRFDEHGHGVV